MAQIIWGFPGIGKSSVADGKKIVDADYNLFMFQDVKKSDLHGKAGRFKLNPKFPENFINYVDLVDADIVLINCDISLLENFENVELVYPDVSLKEEYFRRYIERGDNEGFISCMDMDFEKMIEELDKLPYKKHKIIETNVFLKDILEEEKFMAMFMTKKEMIELFEKGVAMENSEDYQKCGSTVLKKYGLSEINDFGQAAMEVFEGERELDFKGLETDILRAEVDINKFHEVIEKQKKAEAEALIKEQKAKEKRGGLSREELADKIMMGIVNGALGIRYSQIAPYSHGYEVTFGGEGPVGSTRDFKNRWECYCSFFEIGNKIVSFIENDKQHNECFGKKCEAFHLDELLAAIDKREREKITTFTLEKDTDFRRREGYSRGSVATVMDVHACKGLDGIVQHHYHGDYSSMTPVLQNSLVETLVCLNGFCLDCVGDLDVGLNERGKVIEYLKQHGTDVSTLEKLQEWIRSNPDKCGLKENRVKRKGLEEDKFLSLDEKMNGAKNCVEEKDKKHKIKNCLER